jgi:hypothetical protein
MLEMELQNGTGDSAAADDVGRQLLGCFTDLLGVASGKRQGSAPSVDNLVAIRQYVLIANALPSGDDEIQAMIGDLGNDSGISVADFSRVFTLVREHVAQWRPLQSSLANMRPKLCTLGESLEVMAAHLVTLTDDIRKARSDFSGLPTTYKELAEHERVFGDQHLSSLGLGNLGLLEGKSLKEELDDLFTDVAAFGLVIKGISLLLEDFSAILQESLWEKLSTLIHKVESSRLSVRVGNDEKALEALQSRHTQYSEKYIRIQNEWLTFGALGAEEKAKMFPGMSEGDVNERFTAQLAELMAEDEKIWLEWAILKAVIEPNRKRFETLRRLLKELEAILPVFLTADAGLRSLQGAWRRFEALVLASAKDAANVKDDYSLLLLASKLNEIAQPWARIRDELSTFNDRVESAQAKFEVRKEI